MRTHVLFGVSLILSAGLAAGSAMAQEGEAIPAACSDPCAEGLPALVAPGTQTPMVFVADGQAFAGFSAGGARVRIAADGRIELGLAALAGQQAANGTLWLVGASPAAARLGTELEILVEGRLLAGQRAGRGPERGFGQVLLPGLGPGTDLVVSGDARRLRLGFELGAGVGHRGLTLASDGRFELERDGSAALLLPDADGGTRRLALPRPRGVRFRANGRTLVVHRVGPLPATRETLTLALTLAPPFELPLVATAQGRFTAGVAGGLDGSGEPGRALFLAELDQGAGLRRLVLEPAGSVSGVQSLLRTVDGELVVHATRTGGGRQGFESARFAVAAGPARLVLTEGEGSSASVVDHNGKVWTIGPAGQGDREVAPESLSFRSQFPVHELATAGSWAVTRFSHDGRTVEARKLLTAAKLPKAPYAWLDCHGDVVVGVPTAGICGNDCFGHSDPAATYTISEPTGYDWQLDAPNWAELGLQWKDRKATNHTYTSGSADPPVSAFHVRHSDSQLLNDAEASFFSPGDPPGTWNSAWATTCSELAVGATWYIDLWDSPTFSDLPGPNMITEVAWITEDELPIDEYCDTVDWVAGGDPVDVIDETCADELLGSAQLCWVKSSDYHGPFGGTWFFDEHETLTSPLIPFLFTNADGYQGEIPGQPAGQNAYIGDPPAGSAAVPAIVSELARRIAPKVLVDQRVERRGYGALATAAPTTCCKRVRATDMC